MHRERITDRRILQPALVALGLALSAASARADIYTWTDASGRVNISNLMPPEGVNVTSVVHETPKPPVPPQLAFPPPPPPEVQALNDRVRQLEWEVELARRQAPPPTIVYAAAPAPQASPEYTYAPEAPPEPSYGYGCDPSWFGCGLGYGLAPYWYPANVVVVRTPPFHRNDFGRGRYPIVNPLPGRGGNPGRPSGPGARAPGGMSASYARR